MNLFWVSFLQNFDSWSLDQSMILVIIVMYCYLWVITLNQVVLFVYKQSLSKSSIKLISNVIFLGAEIILSELPTNGQNFRYPSEVRWSFWHGVLGRLLFNSSKLPTGRRNFWPLLEVSSFFRLRVLGKSILYLSEFPTTCRNFR
jgi:hypothetical protein